MITVFDFLRSVALQRKVKDIIDYNSPLHTITKT